MPREQAHRHAALVSVANDDQIGSLEIAPRAGGVNDGLQRCVEAGAGDMARAVYRNAYSGADRFGPKTLVIGPRKTAIGVVDDQPFSHALRGYAKRFPFYQSNATNGNKLPSRGEY